MGPKVSDVMTSEVVCARLSTPYQELVRLLAVTHISAAPWSTTWGTSWA
jgi:hypothetical protein